MELGGAGDCPEEKCKGGVWGLKLIPCVEGLRNLGFFGPFAQRQRGSGQYRSSLRLLAGWLQRWWSFSPYWEKSWERKNATKRAWEVEIGDEEKEMSLQVPFCVTIDHSERVWISQRFVSQRALCEDGEFSVRVGRHSGETRVGEQGGCHQPAGKEVQVWDMCG